MNRVKVIGILLIFIMTFSVSVYGFSLPGTRYSISGSESFNEDNNTYTFTIEKSGDTDITGTVDFNFSTLLNDATYGVDFINIGGTSGATSTSGTIAFGVGETSKTITVTIVDDALDEWAETIIVHLSNPTASSGSASIKLFQGTAIKTILDNDPQVQVTLSEIGSPIQENGGVAIVIATLSEPSAKTVVLTLKYSGTASFADYNASSFIITINPGDTQGSVTITGVDDLEDDDDETIVVELKISLNADEVGDQSVTILFANEAPTLTKIPDLSLLEEEQSHRVDFQIFDEDDPMASLQVIAHAENRDLIPDANWSYYGDGTDRSFRVQGAANQTGKTRCWLMVTDGTNWTSRSFIVTIAEENDPPGPGQEPEPIVFNEDETDSLYLSVYVNDPDNDPSELRWTVTVAQQTEGSENVKADQLQALISEYKSYYVIFDDTVPISSVLKDTSQTDTWVIVPQDGPSPSTVEFDTLYISSLDQVNGLYVSIIRSTTQTFFYGTPNFYDSQIPLLFTARDPFNASYSFVLVVTIVPINDAPVFQEPLPNVALISGEMKQVDWGLLSYVEDVDNGDLELAFQAFNSEHVTVSLQSDTLVCIASSDWAGTENVMVIVDDGDLKDTTYCEVTVTEAVASEGAADINALNKPTEYALYENYPNPFNPNTKIEYSIPQATHVTITVYNAIGQAVQVLVDESKEQGHYTLEWNAANLSSGIYFYQIRTADFQFMRRCVLLK